MLRSVQSGFGRSRSTLEYISWGGGALSQRSMLHATGKARVAAGLDPATGGSGSQACPGNVALSQAVAIVLQPSLQLNILIIL